MQLAKQLEDKYGQGSVNLESGRISKSLILLSTNFIIFINKIIL